MLKIMAVCVLNFIPRSHIYRNMDVAACLLGFQVWMFCTLGWSSGPAKLVGWPLQLKTGTAADFTCKLCLKNKPQRQFFQLSPDVAASNKINVMVTQERSPLHLFLINKFSLKSPKKFLRRHRSLLQSCSLLSDPTVHCQG